MHSNNDQVTLVSMVCHGEVLMYLLAAKSLCRQLDRTPKVVVLNDGSFTKSDQAAIYSHISGARIIPIADVVPGDTPKGSCWERLLLISDLLKDSYVVQLDSDTITVNSLPEVKQCVAANRSFTLMGDRSDPEIESMTSACTRSKQNTSSMVQAVCERSLDQLPECVSLKYVRGNAGFTGFAKGSFDREKVEWFSNLMRRIAGHKWDEWGSEQVTSNLMIANTEGSYPLPFPKYLSYWAHPDVPYEDASFIHFIGPHRYSNGFYLKSAKKAIASLTRFS
jgi:hypothetical protein